MAYPLLRKGGHKEPELPLLAKLPHVRTFSCVGYGHIPLHYPGRRPRLLPGRRPASSVARVSERAHELVR